MGTLIPGYIYLIESAGDLLAKTNWIVAGAGDPETIDMTQFTEGTYYSKLQIPKQFRKHFSTGAKVNTGSAGNQYSERSSMRAYAVMADGIESSVANADLVEKFCMLDAHTTGIEVTYRVYHLVIKFGTNSYATFNDSTNTRREYCTGIVTSGDVFRNMMKPPTATVKLNFESVW